MKNQRKNTILLILGYGFPLITTLIKEQILI